MSAPRTVRFWWALFLLTRTLTQSGSPSRKPIHRKKPGSIRMGSSHGARFRDTNWGPSRFTGIQTEKLTDSQLDCLHVSGMGTSFSRPGRTTGDGFPLTRRRSGPFRSKRNRGTVRGLYLTYLLLALGPLSGCLLTLLVQQSVMQSPTESPLSNSSND